MLAVAMLLPFASQAQTDCTSPQTVPYSENFDAYTGNATSTSAPTGYPAITLPDCWSFLNMSATTSTYPQVFLSSSTTYAVSGNCLFFKSGKNMRLFAVLPAVSASATETYELTFMYRNEGTTAYNGTLIVGLMTDVTDSTTFVALDTCARTTTKTEKAVTITGAQLAGARVAICYLGGTSQNYYAAIDNVSLHIAPTCFPVTNLAVTAATTSSMTLTWADAINTTATYIVYDMSDTSVVFSGISDTTYTVTGLDAATNYTFGVASDCGGGDVTAIVTVSGATGCDAITSFPWTEDFESYTSSSTGVKLEAPCWVNEHISGTGTYFFEVYNSTSATGMGGDTTQMLRLHDMSSGTMTKLALPMMDIPVGSNYIFSLDIYRNATGSSYPGEGIRVFVSTDGEIEGATELAFISRNYTVTDSNLIPAEAASGWYNYELPLGVSGSCYIILRGESKYGSATYMDNFVVMEAPSCAAVTGLTMTGATPNSITLGWTDASNTGASYVVYDMSDTSVVYDVVVTDTSAEIFNLTPNTVYTFGVAADCGGDEAPIRTVSGRTACGVFAVPYTWDFEDMNTSAAPICWTKVTDGNANVSNGTSDAQYHSATKYIQFSGIAGNNILALPETEDEISTLQLRFWTRPESFTNASCGTFSVGYMTDVTDATTFVALATYTYSDFSAYEEKTVIFAGAPTGARMAMRHDATSTAWYWRVDDVTIEEVPSCLPVSSLNASGITADEATLSWIGDASSYNVYTISSTDTTLYQTVSDTTITITGLTAMTAYTYGVAAVCGSDESPMVAISFNTACTAIDLPYTETFEATSSTRNCWTLEAAGNIGGSNGMGFVTVNGRETLRFSSYSSASDYNQYGYSPLMNVSSSATNLEVNVTFATYNSANKLNFGYITATDTVWNENDFTTAGSSDFQTETFIIPATATQLAVHYYGNYSYYAWIDSVTVTEMEAEYCFPVSNLTASDITSDGATLTWNGTAAGSYTVVNMADGSVVTSGADTTYTLTGLTAMTQYSYGVVANCTSSNSDTVVVTFNTACTALTLPYTEGFELTSNAIGCWSVEGTGSWTVGTGDYNASTGAFEGTYNAKITHGTTGNATKLVSPALDGVENGMMLDFAYVMRAWSGDVDELRVYTRASETAAWQMIAEYTDAAATWTVANLIIPGTVYQVAFEYTDNYGYGLGIDSVVFTPMSGSFCFPVADLAVDSVTATSVFLSWSDENNTGATYSIYGDEGNVIATNVAGTSYEVTGLTALTGYTFGVVANCSETDASNVTLISASTACAGATCDVYIYAEDSYGDGWNGASIDVMQGGAVVANYTLLDTAEIAIVEVCASAPVSFLWNSGSFDDEASFMIIDVNGDSLFAAEDASDLTDGAVFFNLTAPCGEVEADSLTVVLMVNDSTLGSITPAVGVYRLALGDSITLTATPFGDNVFNGWLTYVDGEVLATLPINPFTLSANEVNVNQTMLLIAQFAAAPDSVTIIINVDNPLMGTTSPAPGTYRVAVGDPLDMVALPNAGFHNLYWIESATIMGTTFTDTLAYDTLNFFASPIMANATLNYTAYFEANPPVESTIDASEITYWVGTGSNQAVVAVNWSNGAYAWGVRFNGESITVQDALDSMAAYDYRFDYSADSYLNNITFDEGNLHLTGLLGSFWESKHNGILDMGLAQTLVNGDFEKWAEPAAGVVTDSVYYDGWGWSYIYTYTMSILPMWAPEPESISITFNVNDPTLGSINPSGVRIFEVGDELTVTATPAEGCSFVSWTVTTAQGETMTLQRDMTSFTDTVEATWNGSTLTANFVRNQGIDEVESADFQAYSLNGKVIVKGVENMDVNVYDVTGRSVNNVAKAAETVEFTVPAAGVYMVKVGNAVKRVVVIR